METKLSFLKENDDYSFYFLVSYESNIKKNIEIISFKRNSKIPIKYGKKKNLIIELFELKTKYNNANESITIEVLIDKIPYSLTTNTIKSERNFLFNLTVFDSKTKKQVKLNCLDINEEFEIYYNYCKSQGIFIVSLISSALRILEEGGENSTFEFYLNILMINPKIYSDEIMEKIKHKGNLSKINEKNFKKIKEFNPIVMVYSIFNDIDFLKENKKFSNDRIVNTLSKYRNLFINSLCLHPNYSFLIYNSDSIEKIKTVLKCSINLEDFIKILDNNKEHISKYIKKDDKNLIIINDFFKMENLFSNRFNLDFYKSLIRIREYELKNKITIFHIIKEIKEKDKKEKYDISLIRQIIFEHIKGLEIKKPNKELLFFINLEKKNNNSEILSFNNYEILTLIDILCNKENKDLQKFSILGDLINLINFNQMDDDLIKFFDKIEWRSIFEEQIYNEIFEFIKNKPTIKDFEFIFFILNKLEELINILLIKEKQEKINEDFFIFFIKKKEDLNKAIHFIISKIQEKFKYFLSNDFQINREEEIIKISSKLIYFLDKYKEINVFLNDLIPLLNKKENNLLDKIILNTYECYEISNYSTKNIIECLLKMGSFKIINYFLEKKIYIGKDKQFLDSILNNHIIEDDNLFLEKNTNNYLLLNYLYKNKYFDIYSSSIYSLSTIKKLDIIGNKVINIKNISYNQMEILFNNRDKKELFSLVGKDFQEKLFNSLEKNIAIIKNGINIIEKCINEFEKFKFLSTKNLIIWLENYKENFKNNPINLIAMKDKIKYLEDFSKQFHYFEKIISSNYFFKEIKKQYKEEKKCFILFEIILSFFDLTKVDGINSEIFTILSQFLLLNNKEQIDIISDLYQCYYLYNIIFINHDLSHKPIKGITSNEKTNIKSNIIKICLKEKIKEIYKKYYIIKEKLINRNFKNDNIFKDIKDNQKELSLELYNYILSFLGLNEPMVYKKEIKDLFKEIDDNKFTKIINLLYEKQEALNFLLSITSQDCRNLQELAGEVHGGNNQNFLSIEELLTIEKIVETFETIKKKFSDIIKEEIHQDKDKDIILSIKEQIDEEDLMKYIEKYQQYKEFFAENLDKNEFTTEIIQKILNDSEFMLLNNEIYNFSAYYKEDDESLKLKNSIFKEFDYNYMIYLRDRALTRNKISDNLLLNKSQNNEFTKNLKEEEKKISENNKYFIEIVHQISQLLKILNKISQKGIIFYFFDKVKKDNKEIKPFFEKIEKINDFLLLKIKIKIEKDIIKGETQSYITRFFLDKNEKKDFNEIYNEINKIYLDILIIQNNAYKHKLFINFIYGKQFYLFMDYFLNKSKSCNFNYFLYYFTNNDKLNIQNLDKYNINLDVKNDKFYQNFIEQCENFLCNLLNDNKLSLESIFQQNKIKKEYNNYIGIYLNGCINLEIEIIQLFKYFTNNIPLASTLLICKQDTTSEEIISFLHRAILCKYHVCFCLARTEILSKEKKNIILDTITELLGEEYYENKETAMNSCFLIMNNNLEDDLCKSLFRLKYIKPLDIPLEKIKDIKLFDANSKQNNNKSIMVVYSDHSGVGKSNYIKRQSEGDYIYFPIGGIFSKEDTLKRLQKLNKEKNLNNKNNLIIHVDLYDTDQKSLMNDFLYFILITKLYGQDDKIFYLSKTIKIYLEIPNSFIDFLEKYPILNLFPKKKLSIDKLEPLIVPESICSNIKIVSLYLKLLKEENELPKNISKVFKSNNKIDKNAIVFPFTPPDLILNEGEFDYNRIVIKAEEENKKLTQKVCQNLIMEEIEKSIKNPTYYQIITFINVLANQLIQFNRNYFLSACTILDTGIVDNCSIRSLIIRRFIDLTKYFTKGAFTELKDEQRSIQVLMNSKSNEKEKIEEANNILENCKHKTISFGDMDLALVFFHGGDNSNYFSIITNKEPNDKTYIDLLKLKNFQSGKNIIKRIHSKDKTLINLESSEQLNDYKKYNQKQFLEELKSILDLKNPIDKKENAKISLSEITKDYVFTVDNFIKMCLILIRLRANIPVIMMGETGCGKTSLIRKLSELQNDGNCLLVTDNIHAGHSNEDIINFINKNVIPKAEELEQQESIKKKKYEVYKQVYEEKKLWVFFDELNTCKSMDLLSEIICKNTCQGEELPKNIVFIGAVNPYRKSKQKRVGLKINKNDNYGESDLVYTVNPLPHSLLNYVFDFGNLEPKDEKSYIINMVHQKIKEEKLYKLATELIIEAQNFIRKENGNSSVSLREIRRFILFYEFFLNYFKIRKDNAIEEKKNGDNEINYSELNDEQIKIYSINLSIYLGYYLRLTDIEYKSDNTQEKGLRQILFQKLNEIYKKETKIDFLKIPELEENFIADNVELEKGIAKNKALLENLFSLFVAINTKIPIFILGKPGCSKSLSVQLINNAMKGDQSNNSFFRKYPKMYVSTYQGALNSTSEGVKAIFDKAREILKVSENKNRISTIYFDEMGLAEHSPHNPLKVIHSELEYDLNEDDKKVSFVGVSNWTLDSSKMNRGITINILDPTEKDIKNTSIIIAQSYLGENLENVIITFFESLGSCYFKYKQELKKNNIINKYQDFHGNRDFYHLIKYSANKIKEANANSQQIDKKFFAELAIKSIGRNFGGLLFDDNRYTTGFNLILEQFYGYNSEVENIIKENTFIYNIKEKILDNLIEPTKDYLSRYLLLITKSNIGIYLLTSFLRSINKENNNFNNYTIFIGSMFTDDIQKEEYTTKILSKIKMNMEKETILVLKDMESIYSSLYDFFNQNFVKVKGKKYARIALGSSTNSFSEVNNNFRCVIIVDENKVGDQEIPFLNRFEKQNISFEYLMNKAEILQAKKLYEKCQNMIIYDEEKLKIIDYNIDNLLINCDKEEINGFIYMLSKKKDININEDYYEDLFSSQISSTLPQDIILILLSNRKIWEKDNNYKNFYNKILENYNKYIHNNIKNFLSNYEDEDNKIVIYTFTNVIENIRQIYLESINIKKIGLIKKDNIKEIRISSIQNEFNLETEIEEFLDNDNLKICFVKLLPNEYSYIDYLKTIIENKERENKAKKEDNNLRKLFIFLVHLERIFNKDLKNQNKENLERIKKKIITGTLTNLAEYNQIFIDDINGQDYFDIHKDKDNDNKIISLEKIMEMKNNDLFEIFLNKEKVVLENLNSSLCYFDYSFNIDNDKLNKDKYIDDLIELFNEDKDLVKIIDELIISIINSKYDENKKEYNLFEKIIKEERFSRGDICIFDIIKKVLTKNYLNEFKILYIELEKNYYFSSILNNNKKYIDNKNNNNKKYVDLMKKIKEIFLKNINLKNKIPENEIKLDIIIGYNLPSKDLLDKIYDNISVNKEQYRKIEEQFKINFYEPEEFEEGNLQFNNKISFINSNTQNNLSKNEILKEIEKLEKGEKNEFYNLLFEDYLLYFFIRNCSEEKINNINDIKSFLKKIILDYKFKLNNCSDLKNLSILLNWIESYSNEIISLIKYFCFISSFVKENLLEKLNDEITLLNNEYDNIGINKNIKIINKVFYIIIGSLVNILISNLNDALSEIKDIEKFNIFINNLNNMYYSLLLINNNLNLSCKEVYLLHQTIKIISILSFEDKEEEIEKEKKMIIDFIKKKIINTKKEEKNIKIEKPKLKDENQDNKEDKEDTEEEKKLKENLENYYNYYKEKKNVNLSNSFSSVLFDEFSKEYNEKYRKHIFNKILNDDNLIRPSILLIKMIIAEYLKPEKEYMDEALDYISNEETYFPLLNDSKKEIVEKNIMKIFDSTIILYFESLDNLKESIKSELFDIFKEYLRVLEDKTYDKYYDNYCNENLVKLYCISFVKIYLKRLIDYIYHERNSLEGGERKIIEEICKDFSISNTLKFYIIILLYKKNTSLDLLKDIIFEKIKNFSDILKEKLKDNYTNVLAQLKIPNEENYIFNEYFNYIEYPSFDNFKNKLLSKEENLEKYPLLQQYIKNENGPKKLKYLSEYNDFVNSMINYYSGRISRNEAIKEERTLNLEENFKNDEKFKSKFEKFKKIWNEYLSSDMKKYNEEITKSSKFKEKFGGNERLAYFLNDDDDKGYGIFISNGLHKFIEWQNSFLKPIIKAYKSKKNNILNCYISNIEESINIQNANNLQIIQIEKCFEKTPFINFNELLNIYVERNIDNINDFIYDFEKIEQELGKFLLPNKCLFNEKNIKYITYQNEGFKFIKDDFLINFSKKYGEEELNEEERKKIFENKDNINFDYFYDSFILLVNYLNNNYHEKKETKIIDFINKAKKKYINFSNQFEDYFTKDGKDIILEKLLNSILYMEHLYYDNFKDNIDNNFNYTFDKGQKLEIENYFKSHNDAIITKKEISSAVRRFITRYLLNDNRKQNIDPNLKLSTYLKKKYLWNNKIFDKIGKNFEDLIKNYLDKFSFSLEVKHSLEFYNIIGEEEEKLLKEEKNKFFISVKKNEENILDKNQQKTTKTLGFGLGGKKSNKGPKMKKKNN